MLPVYLTLVEGESEKTMLESIYIRYKGLMLSRAYDILRDRGLAEDAVHEAFLRILRNLNKLDSAESLRTKSFVVTVVENTAKTMYVKQNRTQALPVDEELVSTEDVIEQADARMTAEQIAKMIELLPEKLRNVMTLRYLNGLNDKEIASALGISGAAVRKRLERARRSLGELMGKG